VQINVQPVRVIVSFIDPVAGLGFGIISGAFALVNVLADAAGPGTVGIAGGDSNFFLISAYTTLAFVLMHTFWGVIFFQSLDQKKYYLTAFVVLSHLFVSCMSLVNQSGLHWLSLLSAYFIVVVAGVLAFFSAGGSFRSSPEPQSL
jgi:anterior pharynx defective protein 1